MININACLFDDYWSWLQVAKFKLRQWFMEIRWVLSVVNMSLAKINVRKSYIFDDIKMRIGHLV